MALGTDYPFPLGEWVPGKLIENMNWNDEKKRRLLWLNGLDFLGGEEQDFNPDSSSVASSCVCERSTDCCCAVPASKKAQQQQHTNNKCDTESSETTDSHNLPESLAL